MENVNIGNLNFQDYGSIGSRLYESRLERAPEKIVPAFI